METIDYEELLELAVDLGYEIQSCGAETYRVEQTIDRIMEAYGAIGEAFVIPNCIIASAETTDGRHLNRMRRSKVSTTDLDSLERYNALSRRLCAETPPIEEARALLSDSIFNTRVYKLPILLLGDFLAGAGFCMLFHGTFLDALCGGLTGMAVGLWLYFVSILQANPFFKTTAAAFIMALFAHGLAALHLCDNVDAVISGPLMILVPGLLFTNSMRDVIYGDTMSGVNRLVQVLIIAVAMVVGAGFAVSTAKVLWGPPPAGAALLDMNIFWESIAATVGSIGFCILFNIHGGGMVYCLIGAWASWFIYRILGILGASDVLAFFVASAAISFYSEIMARIRKYPATAYLVVGLFPLIPGGEVYRTMTCVAQGDMAKASHMAMHTAALAGALAVGILMVATVFRMWSDWKRI